MVPEAIEGGYVKLVSEAEFLGSEYDPNCEYIDGILRPKPWPNVSHSRTHAKLGSIVENEYANFWGAIELTVPVRKGKYLIPDVSILRTSHQVVGDYPTEPVHVCVEILSPTDKFWETLAKCDEYLQRGVSTTWILDPRTSQTWIYDGTVPRLTDTLTADGLSIPVARVFAAKPATPAVS